jgi:hypothetical protein
MSPAAHARSAARCGSGHAVRLHALSLHSGGTRHGQCLWYRMGGCRTGVVSKRRGIVCDPRRQQPTARSARRSIAKEPNIEKRATSSRADTSASARFESLTECPPRMGPSALPSMRVALCRGSMPAPHWMSPAPKPCRKHSAAQRSAARRQSHQRASVGSMARRLGP